jgi:hypothetical protein
MNWDRRLLEDMAVRAGAVWKNASPAGSRPPMT